MKNKKIILTTLSPKTHRTSEENLGIEYLKSSLVKDGHEVEIIDAWLNELEIEEVYKRIISQKENLLFVGISSYMSNTAPTIKLISMLKKCDENIKVVCGGFGPTFYPEDYLKSGSDYIIRGEGENAICKLADFIESTETECNVKNVGYLKDNHLILNDMECLNDNLDYLPFPSRDTMNTVLEKKSSVNMITARGCSGNCEFCSVISFFRLSNGKVWRTRSIQNIVDEIEELSKKGVRYIKMVDDSFVDGNRDEEWCKEFADEIERRNLKVKLRGQIRADKVTDSILYDLKRAGFFSFACGIENGAESALSRMNKKATVEDNKRALELFKKYGYIVQMGYILFDKETTYQELVENYQFMLDYDFAITKGIFSEMFSAEGTALNTRLRNENKLQESSFINNNNKYTLDDDTVEKIYFGLKKWHKSHSEIYDMTIDPLTAPKAISESSMNEFYQYVMKLKKLDLMLFKSVLLEVKKDPNIDIEKYIEKMICKTKNDYCEIEGDVRKLYRKNKLSYKAEKNPFI